MESTSIFRIGSNFDGVYDNEDRRMATKKIFVKLLFLSVLKAISGSNWVIGGSNKLGPIEITII